jgi:LPS O-antigen subunit length determinant protein (WzzB/FepE family)
MNEKQNNCQSMKEDVGLLDVLLVFAENIKLLTVWPLIVGLCVLAIGFVLPQTYQSISVLQADQATASLMTTTSVLDPVIATLDLAKDKTLEEARSHLKTKIAIAIGRGDKLLTLTVSADSARNSQVLANALLRQTYLESRPKGGARTRLDVQLAEAKARLNNAQSAAAALLKRLESSNSGVNGGAEMARGYADLLTAAGAAQTQISILETQLEGVSDYLLIQPPSLPEKASQPKKLLIAIGAALATGMALLLFVFMRQALRNTAGNARSAEKLARIRQFLSLQ